MSIIGEPSPPLGVHRMGLWNIVFGNDHSARAERDQYRPSVIGKNLISPINSYGTCFGCEGAGTRTLTCNGCGGSGSRSVECRGCAGSGRFERPAKPCFRCNGTGSHQEKPCPKCNGSGVFQAAINAPCNRCSGTGQLTSSCRRCSGAGTFTVTCKRCEGSGWHKSRR